MSRVGKLPISIPKGVEFKLDGRQISVSGPKGKLEFEHHAQMQVTVKNGTVEIRRRGDSPAERSLHGLTRSLLANMVKGVTAGFERNLQIVGIGYKAQMQGSHLVLNLGHSHPINFSVPDGITILVDSQTQIKVAGIDKQRVGQVAAEIRAMRPVEPYKGKGIRYAEERVKLKEGKTAA